MAVIVGAHGLYHNNTFIPIYSGTIHYWRHDPELWQPLLQRVRDLGFQMIETYIPWGVHERAPGVFDWGQHDPHTDLPRFLALCHALDIAVCVRPGPHINAELTWFGFPQRLLADPAVWARTASGSPAITDRRPQPFAIPSYASETFFAETARYFDALCPVLLPYLAPAGPIVACQVDNETCYFFRDHAYDLDYSADSLALYRRMLRERYGNIATLNHAYRRSYADFAAVEPPRDFEATEQADVPRHLDWVAYKEYHITTALNRIGGLLRERGIQVPLYHDIAFQTATPVDTIALEAQPFLDFVGTNLYANQEEYATIARRIRYLAGSQRLPFVPEFGSGVWWNHHRTFTPAEQEFVVLCALMHGLKALNFYMLVERDRWQGSPITRDNRVRPEYAPFFQRLSTVINETKLLETDKQCRVLVLQNYELARFVAAYSTLHHAYLGLAGVPPSLSQLAIDLGYDHDPAHQSNLKQPNSWICRAMGMLEGMQVEYDLADTHAQLDVFTRYQLVLVPTADFMDIGEQQRLLAYVADGGHVVFGPAVPHLDRLMRPASPLAAYISAPGTVTVGRGQLTLVPDPAALDQATLLPHRNVVTHTNPALRLTTRVGATSLCFVANPTAASQETRLHSPAPLRGVWNTPATYPPGAAITVPPYTVHVWELAS